MTAHPHARLLPRPPRRPTCLPSIPLPHALSRPNGPNHPSPPPHKLQLAVVRSPPTLHGPPAYLLRLSNSAPMPGRRPHASCPSTLFAPSSRRQAPLASIPPSPSVGPLPLSPAQLCAVPPVPRRPALRLHLASQPTVPPPSMVPRLPPTITTPRRARLLPTIVACRVRSSPPPLFVARPVPPQPSPRAPRPHPHRWLPAWSASPPAHRSRPAAAARLVRSARPVVPHRPARHALQLSASRPCFLPVCDSTPFLVPTSAIPWPYSFDKKRIPVFCFI